MLKVITRDEVMNRIEAGDDTCMRIYSISEYRKDNDNLIGLRIFRTSPREFLQKDSVIYIEELDEIELETEEQSVIET